MSSPCKVLTFKAWSRTCIVCYMDWSKMRNACQVFFFYHDFTFFIATHFLLVVLASFLNSGQKLVLCATCMDWLKMRSACLLGIFFYLDITLLIP